MSLASRAAGHKAVKRHLNFVTIRISDDDASTDAYYLVSVVSKIRKRYVSFNPDPLESQRRLGKRRLACGLQRMPTYQQSLWSWWSSFKEVDFTQWKWEPPRMRTLAEETCTYAPQLNLSKWIITSCSSIKKYAILINIPIKVPGIQDKFVSLLYEKERALRNSISDASINGIKNLYHDFKETLGINLIRGTLCEGEIEQLVDRLTEEFRTKLSDSHLAYSLCYSLYQTIWEGVRAKSLTSTISSVGIALLRGLSNLPSTSEVQYLISDIIRSFSIWNNTTSNHEIFRKIVKSWVLSWSGENKDIENNKFPMENKWDSSKILMITAEKMVLETECITSKSEEILLSGNNQDVSLSIRLLKQKILLSLQAITNAENFIISAELSAYNLAKILNYLPLNILCYLLHVCSKQICEEIRNHASKYKDIKWYWLSTISQIPRLYERDFLGLLKYMDTHSEPLCSNLYPQLIINRWISKDNTEDLKLASNIVKISALGNEESGPWVSLIYAIYQSLSRQSHFKKIGSIFRMLYWLGETRLIGKVVLDIKEINPRLPAEILEFVVNGITDHDPEMAWKIVMLSFIMKPGRRYKSQRYPRGDYRTIRFSNCSRYVVWMINNSKINPTYIWRILRVPIHANYSKRYRNQPSTNQLHPLSVNLFKKMMFAFAYAKRLSPRVAFRNVMQCWHHLRHYKVPLDDTLTKALVHSGLARYIESSKWVPNERLYWLLCLIKQAEGPEIADQVEHAVREWNAEISAKQARLHRESNVLRVGQID